MSIRFYCKYTLRGQNVPFFSHANMSRFQQRKKQFISTLHIRFTTYFIYRNSTDQCPNTHTSANKTRIKQNTVSAKLMYQLIYITKERTSEAHFTRRLRHIPHFHKCEFHYYISFYIEGYCFDDKAADKSAGSNWILFRIDSWLEPTMACRKINIRTVYSHCSSGNLGDLLHLKGSI